MTKSWSFTTGRASVAVVICGVLLGACGGTGRHARRPAGTERADGHRPDHHEPGLCEPVSACHLDPVQQLNLVNSPVVSHRYALPGQHTIRIWAKLGCGTDQRAQYSTTTVYSYPSAPPGAAGWPRCQPSQPSQLSAALVSMGLTSKPVSAAATLVIIPPDDFTSLRVIAKIAACNGDLTVSAVVPGTTPIPFG
jgi:hypothetical protein